MLVSVIICTHNPEPRFLNRTIQALKNQLLKHDDWELLLVDNLSTVPISETFDISWHPLGKIVREDALGLTNARIRGIAEAKGDLIIFVDDDNCLKDNYLELVAKTMNSMPLLGVLGAGNIIPEFEVEPTANETPFLRSLALRSENRAYFSNEINYNKALPFGAGICIRKSIANLYIQSCATRPFAASLDRIGDALLSGGDIDLALHACKEGYLAGVLPELEVVHLIPKERLDHKYLVKIAAGHAASNYILSKLWKYRDFPENQMVKWLRYFKRRLSVKGLERKILIVEYRAEKQAQQAWESFNANVN
jgi:glycosyltransferase involved in cell wall biosynthesis